ncbi:MAG: hypothetical protein IBX60_00405 [Candidatus Aminicenantes bacterium]|nr:hypothetical protein [Candidatus Aminicenantes bacterium]
MRSKEQEEIAALLTVARNDKKRDMLAKKELGAAPLIGRSAVTWQSHKINSK